MLANKGFETINELASKNFKLNVIFKHIVAVFHLVESVYILFNFIKKIIYAHIFIQ